ncbi:MAG: hypothetical protein K8T91_09090 [Planctomycetes bacterium]|nr:hypothetical protein [Planctomycetota bacterium]
MEPTFADDVALMKKHFEVIVLKEGDARVAVAPALQGRVMTSSAARDNGPGFGWINREFIAAGKIVPQINVNGGEDRFWLGPEGGQFSIFFPKGMPFEFKHWQTPALIDTVAFDVLPGQAANTARFHKVATISNYSGTEFKIGIDRVVNLLSPPSVTEFLGTEVPAGVKSVAYQTQNTLKNNSDKPWSKDTGLLSIWILGMYKPGPQTTVVIPFKPGSDAELGTKVIDDYFGKVPADRLVVRENVLFFNGDGKHRGKIGLTPQRALPVMGSYDAAAGVLTIVQYTKPEGVKDYVNSKWEIQKHPFAGDVVNSYNDGPPAPGAKPLGPFYELESSSSTRELQPGESLQHVHRTIHLQGSDAALDPVARKVLGVSIADIKAALPK